MSVFPAPASAGGEPWSLGLDDRGWDRSRELLDGEAAAIAAIGPVGLRRNRATGIPRRTARHWNAISRLAEPLDAARAALHHDDACCGGRWGRDTEAVTRYRLPAKLDENYPGMWEMKMPLAVSRVTPALAPAPTASVR